MSENTDKRFNLLLQRMELMVSQPSALLPQQPLHHSSVIAASQLGHQHSRHESLAQRGDFRGVGHGLEVNLHQPQHPDESLQITAMAGWPEMALDDVGHAEKFKPWKKLYSEYVSKCTDKTRTPATMAQAFAKWASWFATAFTEQERQRHDQEGSGSGWDSIAQGFRTNDVLALTDAEFTRRYLAFCQVKIKDPSQVLQLLSTPKVDASSGGLVELMQAAQSFSEQLQLIPKSALAQCQQSQIREAFIASIFGSEQLRERKVDYLKCPTWDDACQFMIRKASGPSGCAYAPFKPLKEISKTKPAGDKASVDKDKDKSKDKDGKEAERSDAPDMSTKAEQKWKARFHELATEYSIRNAKHAFAASWKIRYAYLLDCVSQDRKCRRCRTRGHLPSSCSDPLPEVPYPTLSAEQREQLQHLRLVTYDQEGNSIAPSRSQGHQPQRQSDQYHDRDSDRGRQDRDSDRGRGYSRDGDRGGAQGGYNRDRSHSRDRDRQAPRGHSRDGRQEDSRSYDRGGYQPRRDTQYANEPRASDGRPDQRDTRGLNHERGQQRDPSRERRTPEGGVQLCYRCDRPGHRANECEADTHADGRPLARGSVPRNSDSRSPTGRSSQFASAAGGQQRRA